MAELSRAREAACPTCESAPAQPSTRAGKQWRKRLQRKAASWNFGACLQCDGADAPAEREADRSARAALSGDRVKPTTESAGGGTPDGALRSTLESSTGGGGPLPDTMRERLEPRLGTDLSDVRVHADGHAHRLATQLGASAFTYGPDIYFRQGAYDPASQQGRETLAHEVVHTVQQRDAEPAVQRDEHDEEGDEAAPLSELGNPVATALAAAVEARRARGDAPDVGARPRGSRRRPTRAAPVAEDRFAALRGALPGLGGDVADFAAAVYAWSGRLWGQLHVRGPAVLPQPLEQYLAYRAELTSQVETLRAMQEEPSVQTARRWVVSVLSMLFAAQRVIARRVAQPGTFATTDVLVGELDRLQARGRALTARLPGPERPPVAEAAPDGPTDGELAARRRHERTAAARILEQAGTFGVLTEADARRVAPDLRAELISGRPGVFYEALVSTAYTFASDDVARAVLGWMSDDELLEVASTPEGRRALLRAYDELRRGWEAEEDERTAARVREAVGGGEIAGRPRGRILTLPFRRPGVMTGTSGAPINAAITEDGQIRISYPVSARDSLLGSHLPIDLFLPHGYIVAPDEIVRLVDEDEGGVVREVRAIELLDYARMIDEAIGQNALEAAAIALLPFSIGGALAYEGTSAIAIWMARISIFSDVFGTFTTLIDELRGPIIRSFGESGRAFADVVQTIDAVLSVFQLGAGGAQFGLAALGSRLERLQDAIRVLTRAPDGDDVAAFARALRELGGAESGVHGAIRGSDAARAESALDRLEAATSAVRRAADEVDLEVIRRFLGGPAAPERGTSGEGSGRIRGWLDSSLTYFEERIARARTWLRDMVPSPQGVPVGADVALEIPEIGSEAVMAQRLDAAADAVYESLASRGGGTRATRSLLDRLVRFGRADPGLEHGLSTVMARAQAMEPDAARDYLRGIRAVLERDRGRAAALEGFLTASSAAVRPSAYVDDLSWLCGRGLSADALAMLGGKAGRGSFDLEWFRRSGLPEALARLDDLVDEPGGLLEVLARNSGTEWGYLQTVSTQYRADPSSVGERARIAFNQHLRAMVGEAVTAGSIGRILPGHSLESMNVDLSISGAPHPTPGDRAQLDLSVRTGLGRSFLDVKALGPEAAASLLSDLREIEPGFALAQVGNRSTRRLLGQMRAATHAAPGRPVYVAVPDDLPAATIVGVEQELNRIFTGQLIEVVLFSGSALDETSRAIRAALGLPARPAP